MGKPINSDQIILTEASLLLKARLGLDRDVKWLLHYFYLRQNFNLYLLFYRILFERSKKCFH